LPDIGPMELIIVLVVVVVIFRVGRLPEVGGAIGKSIREFRREADKPEEPPATPLLPAKTEGSDSRSEKD